MKRLALSGEVIDRLSLGVTPEMHRRLNGELGQLCIDLECAIAGNPIPPCEPEKDKEAVEGQITLVASVIGSASSRPWVKIAREAAAEKGLRQAIFFDENFEPEPYQENILSGITTRIHTPREFQILVAAGVIKSREYAETSALVEMPGFEAS